MSMACAAVKYTSAHHPTPVSPAGLAFSTPVSRARPISATTQRTRFGAEADDVEAVEGVGQGYRGTERDDRCAQPGRSWVWQFWSTGMHAAYTVTASCRFPRHSRCREVRQAAPILSRSPFRLVHLHHCRFLPARPTVRGVCGRKCRVASNFPVRCGSGTCLLRPADAQGRPATKGRIFTETNRFER